MKTIDETIAGLGLTYTAEFVPQKVSRNADDKHPSINWRITLSKNGNFITTDYMQGIGHIPTVVNKSKHLTQTNEQLAANTGRYKKTERGIDYPLPKPELKDILYSLTMDSDVSNYSDFEEWADSFGYNVDSIKDKAVYEACQTIARQFKKLVNLAEMQELFTDY